MVRVHYVTNSHFNYSDEVVKMLNVRSGRLSDDWGRVDCLRCKRLWLIQRREDNGKG